MGTDEPDNASWPRRLVVQFVSREAHPTIQFVKYGIAGGLATGAHIVVFFVLSIWIFPALLADQGVDAMLVRWLGVDVPVMEEGVRARNFVINNLIAFLFGNAVAYLINFHWVFTPGRHRRIIEVTLFLIISAIAMLVGVQIGVLIIQFFGATTTVSQLGNIIAAVLINYICRKYIVFKR